MKKTLVILAHSFFDKSVTNKYLMENISKLENIDIHVLPTDVNKINVKEEQELLLKYDNIVFQFPVFWFNMPHTLKYWMDMVIAYGFAYGKVGNKEDYKLAGKTMSAVVTTGAPLYDYTPEGFREFAVHEYFRDIKITAKITNMVFKGIIAIDSSDKEKGLAKYIAHLEKLSK